MGFDTQCVACLPARNEMGRSLWPLMANMLFVSMKFVTGEGFCEIFLPLCTWIHRVV